MHPRLQGVTVGLLLGLAVHAVAPVAGQPAAAPAATGIIRNVEHINITTPDGNKLAQTIADVFGLPVPPETSYKQVVFPADYKHDPNAYPKFHTFALPNVRLEIIEPVGGKSPWRDALDANKGVSAFHHIEIDVQNLEDVIARLKARGVKQTLGDGKRFFAYMESKELLGFALELNRVDATGKKVDVP